MGLQFRPCGVYRPWDPNGKSHLDQRLFEHVPQSAMVPRGVLGTTWG